MTSFSQSLVGRAKIRSARVGASDADFRLIDTAPGATQAVNEAPASADVAILPTSPGVMDMVRTWSTEAESAKIVDTFVLLVQVDSRIRSAGGVQDVLKEAGVGYFETVIPRREVIDAAIREKIGK